MANRQFQWRLYTLVRGLYLPVWIVGTALVVLSWVGIATPHIGWIGFYAACGAAFVSYILPWMARGQEHDIVLLDSRMLQAKDGLYHDAIKRFLDGADLFYDGLCFGIRPDNEIACAVVSPSALHRSDDQAARDVGKHAESVFKDLKAKSSDIAIAVADLQFRISIFANDHPQGDEICRIVGDEVKWRDLSDM